MLLLPLYSHFRYVSPQTRSAVQAFGNGAAVCVRRRAHSAAAVGAFAGQRRGLVLPAEAEPPLPEIHVDSVGAVSIISESDPVPMPGVFRNIDGHRNEDGRYAAFTEEISGFIPRERQFTDPVRTFAYGTDASFYRLNPRMVVKARLACASSSAPAWIAWLHTIQSSPCWATNSNPRTVVKAHSVCALISWVCLVS